MKKVFSVLMTVLGFALKVAFGAFKLMIAFLSILISVCADVGRNIRIQGKAHLENNVQVVKFDYPDRKENENV